MKRLPLAVLATGVCALIVQNAGATLLFSDGFNYTVGDDLGAGTTTPTWTATATATSYMSIGNANLTYSPLTDLGGSSLTLNSGNSAGVPAYATLSSSVTSGSLYYSFLIECTTLPTSNSYLTGLTPSTHLGLNGSGSDAIDLYAKNSGAGWVLGERTTGVSASYESTVLSLGTTYYAVLKYTFGATTSTAQLFLSPVPGNSEPGTATVTLTGTANVADVSAVGFKAQTATSVGNFVFDDLRVGTTWADVTPAPEPTTLALAGMGILGLVLARRNRR